PHIVSARTIAFIVAAGELVFTFFFFFSSRRRHTRFSRDWSSDVCSSDLAAITLPRSLENSRPSPAVPNSSRCSRSNLTSGGGIEIGRASCRESVDLGGGRVNKTKK